MVDFAELRAIDSFAPPKLSRLSLKYPVFEV